MNRELLQAAIVGLGVGEQHARAYLRQGRCRLRWLLDENRSRAEQLSKDLGDVPRARDFEQILTDPSLDAVSLASYDHQHFEQVVAALDSGKHVFVEKPLCRTTDELRRIKEAWKTSGGLHLSCNLVLRAAPLYIWLRNLVRSGELGEVYAFDGEYLFGRIEKITDGWRKDVPNYSVMQGGGVHLVDLMLWLTGQLPETVWSAGNRICTAGTAFRYNDYMASTFLFQSGLIGRVTANFGCVHRHQHVLRVFGTKGTFIYDDCGARLSTGRDPARPSQPVDLSPLPKTKGDLIPGFVEGILLGKDSSRETQHEFDLISVCVAADLAASHGAPLTVSYV